MGNERHRRENHGSAIPPKCHGVNSSQNGNTISTDGVFSGGIAKLGRKGRRATRFDRFFVNFREGGNGSTAFGPMVFPLAMILLRIRVLRPRCTEIKL